MLTHDSLDCAKSRLNSESDWLVNGSFLPTESFYKNYLFSVTSLWCTFLNPLIVVHPTHILVHPRVHRAHRLKSADLFVNGSFQCKLRQLIFLRKLQRKLKTWYLRLQMRAFRNFAFFTKAAIIIALQRVKDCEDGFCNGCCVINRNIPN